MRATAAAAALRRVFGGILFWSRLSIYGGGGAFMPGREGSGVKKRRVGARVVLVTRARFAGSVGGWRVPFEMMLALLGCLRSAILVV